MSAVLNVTEIKGVKIVSFDGINRFNAIVSQSVKEQINLLLSEPGAKVIFNLVGVRFIDSSAFGALISNFKNSKIEWYNIQIVQHNTRNQRNHCCNAA